MANKRNTNEVRLLGVARRGRAALALTTALQASAMMVLSLPSLAQPPALAPNAQPQGGTTVAGSATISQTATTTTINQTSQRAALNWQSFNVGSQQTVNFQQPSSSAVALNRVVGPDPSQIAGHINANGQVVLVNQSGVVFTQGAQVNAASLLVSTAGITNQNFMAGAMKFDQAGNPNARIENAGNITVKQAGLAALVAPQVANSGTITATLGHVVLAGAKTATLDMYGDGLVALDVTNQVTQVPVAADGTKATALVTNTGTILAAGGTVQLTARAADGVVQTLVNAGGKIATPSLGNRTGTISLNAIGGSVVVEGQLAATGDTPGSTGGAVGVLATDGVGIAAGATVDASGKAGGGVVAIGTTLARAKGGPSVTGAAKARNVVVQQGATIAANATVKGNGGRVTVLSSNVTRMDGAIAAKGGPQGGNGGFVEVSGNTLGITTGSLDVSAPKGTAGTILFDPIFLDIDTLPVGTAGSEDENFFENGGTILVGDGKTATPDTLSASAFGQISGDVLLQAQQTISVNASFSVNLGSLTLQAGSRITVNSGATASADGDVTFQIVPSLGTAAGAPLISILGSVVSNGGGVTLLASPGGSVTIGAAGGVRAEETNVSIQADSLTVASAADSIIAAGGSVEVAPATAGTQVTFAGPGGLELTQGFLTALDTTSLRVGAVTLNGTVTTTAGTISVANVATLGTTGALTLNSTGPVSEAAAAGLSVGQLTGTTGPVGLVGSNNTIALVANYIANGGGFAMRDTSDLFVSGTLSATSGNVYLESASANGITVGGQQLGVINTSTTGAASFQTDQLVIRQGSRITTGTFELAPDTIGGTLEPGNLTPATLTEITSNFVRLGAVTEPGDTTPTVRAGEVLIDTNFDFLNRGVELDATGPIDVSGGTLTNVATLGGTGTTWSLTTTTNTVSNLSDITAGRFVLEDGIVLSVIGTLNATASVFIDNTAGVTVAGAVKAPDMSLQGTTLTIPGLISDGGAGTTNLISSSGGIGETGSVVAGTLSGNAAGTVTLTGTNTVATLSNFFAPSFTMSDTRDLSVSGASGLQGGVNATITDTGVLTVVTTVSANSVSLTAASIAIPGLVTDGGVSGGNVVLVATAGSIGETGTISTTTLSGSATGAATLAGTNTIANLGNFTANGFTLADTGDLSIGGSTGVSGGASASIIATGVLTVNSAVSATAVGLTGSGIVGTGTIVAGTLSGSTTGVATLTGSNTIGTVGNFTANGFTLTDTGNLAIGGTTGVSATNTADISIGGTLTITSTVSAPSVRLSGAAIAIDGLVTDGGTGSVFLTATAGGITETGTLISGNLSGSATGATTLTGNNTIDNIGQFQANGFTLFDTGDVGINSFLGLDGGPSVTITDAGTISVYGDVNATAISLKAADIEIIGTISDGGAGTVALVATAGDLDEPNEEGIPGAIIAGTLTGSATGSVDLEGFNTVAAVGNVAATQGFNLNDTIGLAVGGTTGIAGGAYATITTSGSLTVSSAIGGDTVDLTATSMSISGLISAGTTGPITLIATTGDISGTGSLVGGSLTGTSTGTTDLTGSSTIATVGSFFAAGFTLTDAGNLSVPGTLDATNGATIVDSGTLTIGGSVLATSVGLTGANLAIPGVVSDGGSGTVALVATGGTINETGALTAGTLSGSASGSAKLVGSNTVKSVGNFAANGVTLDDSINLAAGTGANGLNGGAGGATILDSGVLTVDGVFGASVDLTADSIAIPGTFGTATSVIVLAATDGGIAGAGTIVAASLAGSSSAATNLTGPNTIAALGNVAAAGFTLNDAGNLAIAGTTGVSAGPAAAITTTGTLTVTSAVSASSVGLTGAAIAINGLVTDGGTGTTSLTATAGGITETGTLISGSLSGSATGAIALTGSNTIPLVGDVTANGFTLHDTGDLTVSGANGVQGGASATITDSGTLFVDTTISGTAVSLDAAAISILGLVTDGGAGTVALVATGGDIVEVFGQLGTGRVIAGTLTGSATGSADMNGQNAIANIGNFAPDGLSLFDTIGLNVDGTNGITSGAGVSIGTQGTLSVTSAITGTSVGLAATSMTISGLVSAGTTGPLTLSATAGGITGAGTLVAGTLDGTATGAVNLTGANTIGTLGDFSADGFALDDTGNLTVAGTGGIVGGIGATIIDTGTLTIQTGVRATAIALTGGAIAIPGIVTDGGTGTVVLIATGGTISETGILIAGTLSGSAAGGTSLTGSNTIAAIGNFTGNGVTIDDTGNLAAGTGANGLNGGAGGATLVDTGTLTVDAVSGTTVELTGATLAIAGTVGSATTTVSLTATAGNITESGSLIASLLTGSAGTNDVALLGSNTVAAVGNFSAGVFELFNTGNLAIVGTTGVAATTRAGIQTTGTLTVTSTFSAPSIVLTGSAIAIDGLVTDGGAGFVSLNATDGGITETGSLVAGVLSGDATGAVALTGSNTVASLQYFDANGFTLFDTGNLAVGQSFVQGSMPNSIGALTAIEIADFTTQGGANLTINDTGTMTVTGTVTATAVSLNATGLVIEGLVTDGGAGTVTLVAGNGGISEPGGSLVAGTLTGSTPGTVDLTSTTNSIATLGGFTAGGDLSLIDTTALTVTGLVSAGSPSAPAPTNTATLSLIATGGLALGVAGGASATLNAGTLSLTANSAITEPNATIAVNDVTAQTNGTGGDIALASATNQIAASSGIAATNGDVTLIDDPTLVLTGAYSGNNLFFEVNLPGGSIGIGGTAPATLTVPHAGRITLVADAMTATATSTMTAPAGTIEIAPFSAIPETVLGTAATGTLNLDATLLAVAGAGVDNQGTLVLGAFTGTTRLEGGATQVIRATAISIDGTLSLSPTDTTLGLFANGPIAESGGAVAVAALFGTADGGNFTLASPHNAIDTTAGITARNGDIVLVDGIDLTLTGLHSADNEFFEVALAGGTLSVGLRGEAPAQAELQAADDGRISLVADNITATAGSSIAASGGTVELAPYSAINVSLNGTAGLALGSNLLSVIDTGTLVVGGFTYAAGGGTIRSVSAASVSVDGTTDLTGIATALVLDATGAITQPGGALTVAQLGGAGASITLLNAANAIGTVVGLTATAGNVALADTGTLGVAGDVAASGNVYLTSNAVAIAAAGQIVADTSGLASIQANALTLATGATVTAGTFEFAPLAAGSTLALGSGGAVASLTGIDATLARIGAVTLPGASTPTTVAGAIAVGGTFDAAGLNVELDSTGAIVGTAAPLVNIATLSGTGTAWTLTATGNTVAQLGNIAATSFQLTDFTALSVTGTVSAGQGANIVSAGGLTVAANGAIDAPQVELIGQSLTLPGQLNAGTGAANLFATAGGIAQTGTLVAGTLSGSASGAANLTGTDSIATLGNFSAAGFTLADTGNLTVGGTTGVQAGASATITDTGTLTVTSAVAATAIGLAATSLSLPGLVTDGGTGSVNLTATGGGIAQTGTLIAGTLSGSATQAASFGGTNTVATLGTFTANNLALTDGSNLLIAGTVTAPTLSIHAPNSQITLGANATIVTGGGNRPTGAIVATDEPANGAPGAYLLSRTFSQSGASFVTGTMQIGVTGNIAFNPQLGLQDQNGWLILTLTNGTATGDIFVRALDVSYTTPGSAVLTGRIDGVSGQGAAALGNITPATNVDFTFNGCVIGTVTCNIVTQPPPNTPVVQSEQAQSPALSNLALVPLLYTLQNVTPQVLLSPQDLDDLLQLPVVSEQDY